ncbi:MAG TPA: TolC family protein, partial [candidate division Zixibacteria bacterium]|nr:TolC family protein [candidate division Zixibacteria bacterium]
MHTSILKKQHVVILILAAAAALAGLHPVCARDLTLDQALDIAVMRSGRGSIIKGDLEVAEQNYFAERINFYIPEISINGNAPIYNVNESFRFFGGLSQKQLIRTTDLDFKTYIQLQQSLITGGNFTATGNIWRTRSRYPITSQGLNDVTELSQQGVFDFTFEQPILKPSEPKYQLNNRKDDLEIARLTKVEDEATLKKDVINAYFGVLQSAIELNISNDNVESARLQEGIDSSKFMDGILAEEGYLASSSARLDAELDQFDKENAQIQKNRDLALLLDFDVAETLSVAPPALGAHLSDREKNAYINNWEASAPILKARYDYDKAERLADYTASSHGLTGTFQANYEIGRGNVKVEGDKTDNNTNSWGVSLNFTLPVWDGGS